MISETQLMEEQSVKTKVSRILVVDNHPIVRQGLMAVIEQEPDLEVCGEADLMAVALDLLQSTEPDLVILDVALRDGSVMEAIKQLKAARPEARILVFSVHAERLYAEHVLRAGAMGFVSKQEPPDRVLAAMRAILSGQVYLSPGMSERMLHRMVNGGDMLVRSPFESMSDRELEVFGMIGEGMTTRQIAQNLELSPKTVETHRENIKKKLALSSSVELTHRAVRWVLEQK